MTKRILSGEKWKFQLTMFGPYLMLCHVTLTWQLVAPNGDVLPESSSPTSFDRASVFNLSSLTNRWNTSPLRFAIRAVASSARRQLASASEAARWFAAFCCSIHSVLIYAWLLPSPTKQTTRDTTDKTHLSPACKGRFVCETHAARRVIVYEATARCVDSNMTAERKRIDDFNHVTILQGNEIHSGLPSTNSADVTTFHRRIKGEHCARMHEMDEGRKRVIRIMAAILAARKLAVRWREAYPCTRAAERPKAIVA